MYRNTPNRCCARSLRPVFILLCDNHRLVGVLALILFLGISFTLPETALGQSGVTGASLPGVTVTVKNLETGAVRTVATNGEGSWTIAALAVGTYEVAFEITGFRRLVRKRVQVEASVPRTLEDKLELGDVDAVVNIVEGASLVTPETATTFRQLSADDLVTVPTSTRSFTQLLSTEAGVNTELSPVLTNSNGNQSPSVNGTRTTSTSLFFNGIDATNITTNEGSLNDNIAPAPETLQEVKLQTSLYDASTGRSGGGNFQLVTTPVVSNSMRLIPGRSRWTPAPRIPAALLVPESRMSPIPAL